MAGWFELNAPGPGPNRLANVGSGNTLQSMAQPANGGGDPAAFIANWQQTHSPSEGKAPLIAALKQAGFNASPYMYGSTQSGNEISLNGERYKVFSGDEGTPGSSWYVPGSEGGGGSTGGSPSDIMAQDPGYQFRLDEGAKALQRSAAARGTLLTGGTQKALARYGQDYAAGEFGSIFNRNLQLASLGERAASGQAETDTGVGNAQGASSIASGNAWAGAAGGLGNLASFYAAGRNPQTGAPAANQNPYQVPPVMY